MGGSFCCFGCWFVLMFFLVCLVSWPKDETPVLHGMYLHLSRFGCLCSCA